MKKYLLLSLLLAFTSTAFVSCEKDDDHDDHEGRDHAALIKDNLSNLS